jgi:hypothetical protein
MRKGPALPALSISAPYVIVTVRIDMSNRHHKKLIESLPKHPEYKPEVAQPADEAQPKSWIVLEDRTVCARGAITKVRQGKIISDPELMNIFVSQGVKLQPHAV